MKDVRPDAVESKKGEKAEGIYLYCLARSALVQDLHGEGVDGHSPLFLRRLSEIVAVFSVVSLEEFCGSSAESRMRDLSWVGPRVCRHEEVVEGVMGSSPILPVRFGTIFSSLGLLDAALTKHHDAICRFLEWVADKEEWAVKGFLNRAGAKDQFVSKALAAHGERLKCSSPGMQYFQQQRIRARAEKELNSWLKGICNEIARDLSSYASDSRERNVPSSCRAWGAPKMLVPRNGVSPATAHPSPHRKGVEFIGEGGVQGDPLRRHKREGDDSQLGDTSGSEMILNWAFLVSRDAVADFRSRVDRTNAEYRQRGLALEVSGSWPPYSFSPSLDTEP